ARWWGAAALLAIAVAVPLIAPPHADAAQPPVGLGTAAAFAVLGGAAVTNTGPSVLSGDLGVSPGTAISGFPPGTVLGTRGAAHARNIFWQVGSSATLGTNAVVRGNGLALTSITVTTGPTVEGRLLARNGAVTLDDNTVTRPQCSSPTVTSPGTTTTPGTTT